MPKTFPILIEVEEIAVGRVMRLLNKFPGVAKINLNLERSPGKPGMPHKSNGAVRSKVNLPTTGSDDALKALYKNPMTTAQLRDVFLASGRSAKSINSVCHTLKKTGDIKQGSGGVWALTKKARDRLRHHQ